MEARDLQLDVGAAPPPDAAVEPEGFLVVVDDTVRIHFLDWGGPQRDGAVVLVHGLAASAWAWSPVARRLRAVRRTVAVDLRGHGLSDAPTEGYEFGTLVDDVLAAADGALGGSTDRIVLAGHGFGAMVAASAAALLGDRCAGLVLVDGGWEDVRASTGLEPEEFLRELDEPPEVLRSMAAFLADREAFDPGTWDEDQEKAARASVVELPAGRVVPVTPPHALGAAVRTMFDYRPSAVLASVDAAIVALSAADDDAGSRASALREVQDSLRAAGRRPIRVARFPSDGHNLMRYRPAEVALAVIRVASRVTP